MKQTGRGRVVPAQQELRNATELSQRQKIQVLSNQFSQTASSYLAPQENSRRAVDQSDKGSVFAALLAWSEVRATPFQWTWVDGELLCIRRVQFGTHESLQGCWFDWRRIQELLHEETGDLLPNAQFRAVARATGESHSSGRHGAGNYVLASLPVELVPGEIPATSDQLAPTIRHSLWIAWACVSLAIVAVGTLLRGAMALSERRADFVSAVTHELRTPLTTFRLYLDLLTSGRVSEPQRRQEYLTTLQGESERLGHLVENVLRYARLERGKSPASLELISAETVLTRSLDRLRRRAEQSEVELTVDVAPDAGNIQLKTDPLALEQILYNLVDNACKYGVDDERRCVRLVVGTDGKCCQFRVVDEGPGLSTEAQRRLFRPFSKSAERAAQTAAGVGLGLALCRRLARELGGDLRLEPTERGACFVLQL